MPKPRSEPANNEEIRFEANEEAEHRSDGTGCLAQTTSINPATGPAGNVPIRMLAPASGLEPAPPHPASPAAMSLIGLETGQDPKGLELGIEFLFTSIRVEAHIVERILQCINVEKYDRPGEGSLKLLRRVNDSLDDSFFSGREYLGSIELCILIDISYNYRFYCITHVIGLVVSGIRLLGLKIPDERSDERNSCTFSEAFRSFRSPVILHARLNLGALGVEIFNVLRSSSY